MIQFRRSVFKHESHDIMTSSRFLSQKKKKIIWFLTWTEEHEITCRAVPRHMVLLTRIHAHTHTHIHRRTEDHTNTAGNPNNSLFGGAPSLPVNNISPLNPLRAPDPSLLLTPRLRPPTPNTPLLETEATGNVCVCVCVCLCETPPKLRQLLTNPPQSHTVQECVLVCFY